jgi:hypothetical protein
MPPIGTPESSYRYKKPWSPASRDPRFSRATPDALRARIVAANPTGATGGNKAWAARIVHDKARKTPTNNLARARLIEQMKKMAAAAEKELVDATPEVELCSPSAAVRVSRQETEVCQQPQRSVFGSEACAAVVDSPVAPLGRLL